jgi:hypothetical protein
MQLLVMRDNHSQPVAIIAVKNGQVIEIKGKVNLLLESREGKILRAYFDANKERFSIKHNHGSLGYLKTAGGRFLELAEPFPSEIAGGLFVDGLRFGTAGFAADTHVDGGFAWVASNAFDGCEKLRIAKSAIISFYKPAPLPEEISVGDNLTLEAATIQERPVKISVGEALTLIGPSAHLSISGTVGKLDLSYADFTGRNRAIVMSEWMRRLSVREKVISSSFGTYNRKERERVADFNERFREGIDREMRSGKIHPVRRTTCRALIKNDHLMRSYL